MVKKNNINKIAEPCPFCGSEVIIPPNKEWRDDYFLCVHKDDCWFRCDKKNYSLYIYTLIPKDQINIWNKRQ